MSSDQLYMQRALDLAALGLGHVRPNPMVGCVIVNQGDIIGEGWHQNFGGPHAEVMAIESVKEPAFLKESTLYVTLEPCAHQGKTPPCADLIIKKELPKVVIAQKDPNTLVNGAGTDRLKAAGIKVITGVLEKAAQSLNQRFLTFVQKQRPYIILKWAATTEADGHSGFVAKENFDSKWISNAYSRRLVHQWRSEEAAVMVGTNTAQYDNPRLNVRDWVGADPMRVVIDKNLRLDRELYLFSDNQPTICYNLSKSEAEDPVTWVQLKGHQFLQGLFQDLYHRGVQSILVEGGAALHQSLIDQNLWDEARVFRTKKSFGQGIAAPQLEGQPVSSESIMEDQLHIYKNQSWLKN